MSEVLYVVCYDRPPFLVKASVLDFNELLKHNDFVLIPKKRETQEEKLEFVGGVSKRTIKEFFLANKIQRYIYQQPSSTHRYLLERYYDKIKQGKEKEVTPQLIQAWLQKT